jgi:hypothetical protein
MSTNKRHGNKWTINETLSLQREYELLEWSVYKIAEKHQRTVMAIMSKLQKENFIESWNEARGFNIEEYQEDCYVPQTGTNYKEEEDEEEEDYTKYIYEDENEDYTIYIYKDEDDEKEEYVYNNEIYENEIENNVKSIMDRLWSLQTSISEIGSIVKQIFNLFSAKQEQEQGQEQRQGAN